MKINFRKAQDDLITLRSRMAELRVQLNVLGRQENALEAFISFAIMMGTYKIDEDMGAEKVEAAEPEVRYIQNGNFREILAQAIVGAFQAGDILTAREVVNRVGILRKPPEGCTPAHQISPLLRHESTLTETFGEGILRRVGTGQYRLKPNATAILARRAALAATADE